MTLKVRSTPLNICENVKSKFHSTSLLPEAILFRAHRLQKLSKIVKQITIRLFTIKLAYFLYVSEDINPCNSHDVIDCKTIHKISVKINCTLIYGCRKKKKRE